MKKIISLLIIMSGLSACLPYQQQYQGNGQYSSLPQASYNNSYSNQGSLNSFADNSYDNQNSAYGYNSYNSYNNYADEQATNYQSVYGRLDMPISPSYQPEQEYGNGLGLERGVVGRGQTMPTPYNQTQGFNTNGSSGKLIMPNYWRMAHPSIGKGLELVNQQERLNLNNTMNTLNVNNPGDFTINGQQVSLLAIDADNNTNGQGYLCKNAYIVKASYDKIEKMTAKFCKHPNWNEWVLTKW